MNVPFKSRQGLPPDEVQEPAEDALWRPFNGARAAEDYVLDRGGSAREGHEPQGLSDVDAPPETDREIVPTRRPGIVAAGLLGLLAAAAAGAMYAKSEIDPAPQLASSSPESPSPAVDRIEFEGGVEQEAMPRPAASAEAMEAAGASDTALPTAAAAPSPQAVAPSREAPGVRPSAPQGRRAAAEAPTLAAPPAQPVIRPDAPRPSDEAAPASAPEETEPAKNDIPVAAGIEPPADRAAAQPAQQVSGGLMNSDYPRAALKARAEGSVFVEFTVGADGQPRGCSVTRSSGNELLDAATCRIIEQRFRYSPATDAEGHKVEDVVRKRYDWSVRRRK